MKRNRFTDEQSIGILKEHEAGASLLMIKTPDPLRSILVVGATSLLQHVRAGGSRHASRWLIELLQRKKAEMAAFKSECWPE
ncbi:hypothetical protein QO004_002799 [Rhizobium mesoamericanum]|nr:hypothetical protein [Rhizobium mesoamericanum]